MLVTVGQPLRTARTTTAAPCRAHTVFGPPCVSIMARAMRTGSTAQLPTASQRDGLPPAADPRPAGAGLDIDILAMAHNPGRGPVSGGSTAPSLSDGRPGPAHDDDSARPQPRSAADGRRDEAARAIRASLCFVLTRSRRSLPKHSNSASSIKGFRHYHR